MIPWEKFRGTEPTYSDHVYRPTPRILANHVLCFEHHSSLLNAPPLQNADDRRFVVSQLLPDQRVKHFATFHADHTAGIQFAIDTLVGYYERHELKPLSSYDRDGWPAKYDSNGDYVDWQRSSFEWIRKLSQHGEAVSQKQLKSDVPNVQPGLLDNNSADELSEPEDDYGGIHDFPSLAGLSLNSVDGLFEDNAFFDPERVFAPELSLSPVPTKLPSSAQLLQLDDLLSHSEQPSCSPPMTDQLRSRLPLITSSTTASTRSSLPPLPKCSTHANTHSTLSIANLIHPNTSPSAISVSSTGGPDPSDSEIAKLLSDPIASLLPSILPTNGDGSSSNQQPRPASSNRPMLEAQQSMRSQLKALRQGIVPVPLRGHRTFKNPRMRRNSRERAELDKEKARAVAESVQGHQWFKQNRPNLSDSSRVFQAQSQPYSNENDGIDWNQPIERASTPSTSSYAADQTPKEEHDSHAAHQLPTSAIKYEPLDDPRLVPQYRGTHHQQQQVRSLKRKGRDDDDDQAGSSSRPRLGPNSWTHSGAPHWPAVSSYASAHSSSRMRDEEQDILLRPGRPS